MRRIIDNQSSETKHKTLEEIAAAFGDRVVELTENDFTAEQTVFEEKAAAGHIEDSNNATKGVHNSRE